MANYKDRVDIKARHRNVSQEIIEITEDKLQLILQEYLNRLESSRAWSTPFSLLLTIVVVLLTSEFKISFGVKPEIWSALFMCAAIFCAIWLFISLRSLSKVMTIKDFISVAKNSNKDGE